MAAEAREALIWETLIWSFCGSLLLRILVLEVSFGNRKKESSDEDDRGREEAVSVVQGKGDESLNLGYAGGNKEELIN